MKKYLRTKFAKYSGSVSNFNFEIEASNDKSGVAKQNKYYIPRASEYAMRMYAIREGTMYLPMTYSPTFTYIDTFISHAINAPDEDYTPFGDNNKSNVTIHLQKKGSGFKQRAPPVSSSSSSNSNTLTEEEKENAKRIEEVRKRREQRKKESAERELKRAEEMAQELEKGGVFEEESSDSSGEVEEQLDEENRVEDNENADRQEEMGQEGEEVEDMIEL